MLHLTIIIIADSLSTAETIGFDLENTREPKKVQPRGREVDSKPVNDVLAFLVEHLPPQIHLVIATREDPYLPLFRLRARGHLTDCAPPTRR